VGVRVRGPSGHLVLYPAALSEVRALEQGMLALGTRCLHHRAFAVRAAAAANAKTSAGAGGGGKGGVAEGGGNNAAAASAFAAAAAAAPAATKFNLDEDEDDSAVGVDRAALLEDLYEAEARWQGALRGLTTAYLAAAESAADPGDREALRTAAADATFRRPRLDEPPSTGGSPGGAVLSPAGAYAAAVAAVELEAELVRAALKHQREAENASRALCERGAKSSTTALARTLAAGFPLPEPTLGPSGGPLMLATVGWIAEIPRTLAAAETEARARYRVRGAAAGAPLRQAVAAAAVAEWRVLAVEEELRHLLAPAPEDTSAPDWLMGAPPLESPPILDSLVRAAQLLHPVDP
jgi:hypothetical protein